MTEQKGAEFNRLLDYLRLTRGFDFSGYKMSSLMRRMRKRMAEVGTETYADYLDYLEVHPDEFGPLFNTVLINVTGFFRDPEAWRYLADQILPRVIEEKGPTESVRVWSAGCASGQEAYSIAMLLAERLGEDAYRRRVKIYATDADDDALGQARLASYEERQVVDVPPELLTRYFEPVNGRHVFRNDLRRSLIFGRHDLVQDVRRTGERGAALASQLLAFGRRQVLKPEALDLNEVIARMEPMVRQLLGEGAELELRLAPEAGTVYFDLAQLEQVLMNLLVNARDAMPGGGRCTVETMAAEVAGDAPAPAPGLEPGSYVRLAVADTGTGMPPHVRERIFEPFFTTKERGKGSGLGLSTVYGIVQQSGGAIRVESAAGQGTRFDVFLPAAGEPAEREEPPPAAGEEDVRGDESILLVEDEASIRSAACELPEYQGYHVLSAAEATEALQLSAGHEGTLHLLVTDIVLQGMSGFQLAQRLTAERPGLRVLYMSGYPEDSIAEIGHLDRRSFLQKPFPPSQFLQAVRAVLDRPGDAPPPVGRDAETDG